MAAGVVLAGVSPASAKPSKAGKASFEAAVLDEINFARTRPAEYAEQLKEYRTQFDGRVWRDPEGRGDLMTNEGARAVDEAIAVLRRQPPLSPLDASSALAQAALDHARDQGPVGQVGHIGADRSMPERRIARYCSWKQTMAENISYGQNTAQGVVRQLIVDDGVRDRAHRANIFKAELKVAGVGCGPHAAYGAMCVIDFAGGVGPKAPDRPQGVSYYSLQ
ncbi:MAG: CAP domain-containing protein [Caulobacteraceae bacterium]